MLSIMFSGVLCIYFSVMQHLPIWEVSCQYCSTLHHPKHTNAAFSNITESEFCWSFCWRTCSAHSETQNKILEYGKRKQLILVITLLKIFLSSPIHIPEGKRLNNTHAVCLPRLAAFTLILNFSPDLKWPQIGLQESKSLRDWIFIFLLWAEHMHHDSTMLRTIWNAQRQPFSNYRQIWTPLMCSSGQISKCIFSHRDSTFLKQWLQNQLKIV